MNSGYGTTPQLNLLLQMIPNQAMFDKANFTTVAHPFVLAILQTPTPEQNITWIASTFRSILKRHLPSNPSLENVQGRFTSSKKIVWNCLWWILQMPFMHTHLQQRLQVVALVVPWRDSSSFDYLQVQTTIRTKPQSTILPEEPKVKNLLKVSTVSKKLQTWTTEICEKWRPTPQLRSIGSYGIEWPLLSLHTISFWGAQDINSTFSIWTSRKTIGI